MRRLSIGSTVLGVGDVNRFCVVDTSGHPQHGRE